MSQFYSIRRPSSIEIMVEEEPLPTERFDSPFIGHRVLLPSGQQELVSSSFWDPSLYFHILKVLFKGSCIELAIRPGSKMPHPNNNPIVAQSNAWPLYSLRLFPESKTVPCRVHFNFDGACLALTFWSNYLNLLKYKQGSVDRQKIFSSSDS